MYASVTLTPTGIPFLNLNDATSFFDIVAIAFWPELHPCYVEANFLDEIKHVEMIINENEIVAVGEIGFQSD